MQSFVSAVWRAGLRSRSIQAILVLGVFLVGVAYLAAFFSPRQPTTVAMDVGFSGMRISLVLFALFWGQELFGREIERRTVLFALAYPVPRSHYLLGRYFGIVSLLALAAVLLGVLLWLAVLLTSNRYNQFFPVSMGLPFWACVFGLWVDAAVVTAFAMCVSSLSTVPILPLALGLGFAVAGRGLGTVLEYLRNGTLGGGFEGLRVIVEAIQWFLPDLSRLDWRVAPIYGLPMDLGAMGWGLLMAAGYAGLMMGLASLSFSRRQFQ